MIILTLCLARFVFLSNIPVWPLPRNYSLGHLGAVLKHGFYIDSKGIVSQRTLRILFRYENIIKKDGFSNVVPTFDSKNLVEDSKLELQKLNVYIKNDSDVLNEETNESYEIEVSHRGNSAYAKLTSDNVYGAIKGLETFSQLVSLKNNKLKIENLPIYIQDEPLFKHRGLLLDTSRNYYPIEDIRRTIDAMSYNKMNVFHWHLMDSHSFPFESKLFPRLSAEGVNMPGQIYRQSDILHLIEYAKDRGVRIIPEIEAPAHSYVIGKIYPQIGICLNEKNWQKYAAEPPSGQLDPTHPFTKELVFGLIDEFSALFPDEYIHLSGDEVNENCWKTSTKINDFIEAKNLTMKQMSTMFAEDMQQKAIEKRKKVIVWQELLLKNNIDLPEDSLVQVWLGAEDTKKVIERGHRVLASSYQFWYLDCGHGSWLGNTTGNSWCDPYKHWQIVYSYDLTKDLNKEQSKMVSGGEVALWSEQSDETVLDSYLWPRSSAAAEVLWTGNKVKTQEGNEVIRPIEETLDRLNNWRFRMLKRGIKAEPLQPLWCVKNPGSCDIK